MAWSIGTDTDLHGDDSLRPTERNGLDGTGVAGRATNDDQSRVYG